MFYRIDFSCDDRHELQKTLNDLYDYADDIETKVLHRCRVNLFCLIMEKFIREKIITAFGSALDIGCNAGVYSRILSDFGFRRVLGIDIDEEKIEKAQETFALQEGDRSIEFRVLNAEELDPTHRYDFILCTEVIEHTANPDKLIENIKAIIAPGGVAVITLPNKISLPYLLTYLARKLRGKPIDRELAAHLRYPVYRSVKLFDDPPLRRIMVTGTNLVFHGSILHLVYPTRLFTAMNWAQFQLSRLWPFKYFAQFIFIVLKNESSPSAAAASFS